MVHLKIKEYIQEKGISVYFISQKTGIRYATLHDIINNKNTKLNLDYLASIMKAINISDLSLIMEYKK